MALIIDSAIQMGRTLAVIGWSDQGESVREKLVCEVGDRRVSIGAENVFFFVREDVNQSQKLDSSIKSGLLLVLDIEFDIETFTLKVLDGWGKTVKEKVSFDLRTNVHDCKTLLEAHMASGTPDMRAFLLKHKLESALEKVSHIQYAFDQLAKIDNKTLFVSGWCLDERLDQRVEINVKNKNANASLFRNPRHDLAEISLKHWSNAGFYGLIFFDIPVEENGCEILFKTSSATRTHVCNSIHDFNSVKEVSEVLFEFIDPSKDFIEVFEEAYGPVMQSLWKNHYDALELSPTEKIYGVMPENPTLSIIIPLYGRVDFMEYQLAIFANDEVLKSSVEIIYVLDDPERFGTMIHEVAKGLWHLQQVPFKVITYEENLGYARANNMGAKFANAPMLLLLNSDVFPRETGWTKRMLSIYNTLEDPGVLGFKLLFEDGSIQHAGMTFERNDYIGNMWTNVHPHKGMLDLEKTHMIKIVPAVTGACMLLEKAHYDEVGGLSENYVLGDFEDSDLCLKLREKGLNIYYSSEPSLYHLERQSQSLFDNSSWKFKVTLFNGWQQMTRWNEKITALMENKNG